MNRIVVGIAVLIIGGVIMLVGAFGQVFNILAIVIGFVVILGGLTISWYNKI